MNLEIMNQIIYKNKVLLIDRDNNFLVIFRKRLESIYL